MQSWRTASLCARNMVREFLRALDLLERALAAVQTLGRPTARLRVRNKLTNPPCAHGSRHTCQQPPGCCGGAQRTCVRATGC